MTSPPGLRPPEPPKPGRTPEKPRGAVGPGRGRLSPWAVGLCAAVACAVVLEPGQAVISVLLDIVADAEVGLTPWILAPR
ncbi:hypothetical protein [Klugiella xanthotipulae]|uniref:Uncharacterized protein n=1 Tax=Klugiella xanthotipulae TaxID=244735 RepID=A0A543I5D1_9MICO|nr:hypothetical protein [Klugiella xanthotipulae]TQM65680.1 hypothetical protein FB466_0491 [Klugiella xanthotipulae]